MSHRGKLECFVHQSIGRGLVFNSVLFSVALVIATALVVAIVIVRAVDHQVDENADRRLADGAVFFQASLEEAREGLVAVGTWLTRDREFVTAVQTNRPADVEERLALALRLRAVDEVLVADTTGDILGRLRTDQSARVEPNIADNRGLRQALAGRMVEGIWRENEDFLAQVLYLPVPSPTGEQPIGVVRLASFLDERDLDSFRDSSGLDISLFFDGTRVATTLRAADGTPLTGVGPDPATYREVVGAGQKLHAWRDLPIGRVRSYYVPLVGPNDARRGMLGVTVPVHTMIGELRDTVLPSLPVTLLVVVAGAAATYVLGRRARAPLLLLAAAADRLGRGDLSTPIPRIEHADLAPLAQQLELARCSVQSELKAIASSEARQRALFAALREPILTVSTSGLITDCNAAATALLGEPACLQGRPVQDVLPFIDKLPVSAGEDWTWHGRIVDVSGRPLDVEVGRTTLADGPLPATDVYVIHDVSRYAELNRLREQLLYNVSHELRAPLMVLDNALEILAVEYGELSAEEYDRLMRSTRRTVRRLHGLMEDLLGAGSIQSGRFVVQAKPTALSGIVDEALEAVETAVEGRGQRVELAAGGDPLYVLADKRYVRQVLANLLSNASKYGPAGEVIRVRLEKLDGRVRVAVEDRGPGIPADQRAGLFERFYRTHEAHEKPGIGLGLAIARGIVEAHGGTIGVDSEVEAGTRVWFTLPTAESPGHEDPAGG